MSRTLASTRCRLAACAAALTLFAPAASVIAQEAGELDVSLVFGVQGTSVDGARDARFEEYREEPDGALLEALWLAWWRQDSPWSFDLAGEDLLQQDERARLTVERDGRFRFQGAWDRIPHLFSRGSTWLLGGEPGHYTLSPALRGLVEATPGLMPEVLSTTASPFEVGLRRDIASAQAAFRLAPGWELRLDGRHEKRTGDRRISVGTYTRQQSPGSFDRERFVSRGIEMPEPIDYRTTDYGLSTSFRWSRAFAEVGWEGSSFDNDVSTLSWDNPFEAPPSVSSAADRGRFARGAIDLWPRNTRMRLHAAGGFDLPARTRVNAAFAVATTKQDEPFLPFTQNEALFFPGPDGILGNADDVPGTSLGLLPARDLDGRADTTRADLRLTSRPIEALSLRASYGFYDYDDQSRHLVFPGYAAFGESAYRVGIGLRLNGVERLFNEPGGYERTVWAVGGAYRFGKLAALDVEFRSTTRDYDKRQVDRTQEDAVQAKLLLEPSDRVTARLTFLDSSRDFEGPYAIGLETSRIRAFDVWTRDRQRWSAEMDFRPGTAWTLGIAYSAWENKYPGVIPVPSPLPGGNPYPSFPYGLNETTNDSLSLALSWARTRWSLAASAGHDTGEWTSMATSKTSRANDIVQFDPSNRWVRQQDDGLDWAALSFESQLVPEKVRLLVDFGYSLYDGDQGTANPATPDINSGVAYDFPAFETELLTAEVGLQWTLTPRLDLEARYLYEPFRLDDFMWDAIQPYMQGIIQETGATPATIRPADVSRFLFLDSRYSDYTANVISLSLRFRS
jgi:MtrB/PioB family decaheme-associated outer membrane protein